MQKEEKNFIPALGANWATRFYDPLVRLTMREFAFKRALIAQANLAENQTILDLACGTGTLSIGIKKRFPQIDIYAVDADSKILQTAENKSQKHNSEINFQKSFSDKLPFENETFDRVFSTLSFHHLTIENKINTLKEISRVLKPTGEFHIADYGKASNSIQKAFSNIIKVIDGKETTKDNFAGLLGLLMKENGFLFVERTLSFNTMLGTIRLFKAKLI